MGTGIGFIVVALGLVAFVAVFIALYVKFRGKRIVTCPETHEPVSAEINAALAASTWLVTQPRFVVTACSRWPERAGCDQACAPQIEADAEGTRVRDIVTHWYTERTCVYCAKPIEDLVGATGPGLLNADGELYEWSDIAAEDLPRALASSVAVCARCELTEDFRRRYPNRVIDRAAIRLDPSQDVPLHSDAIY